MFVTIVLIMCLLLCLKRHRQGNPQTPLNTRKRKQKPEMIHTPPTSNLYTVPTNFELPFDHAKRPNSAQGDLYAVPLHLVPSSFDYNAEGVEHKGDYILVKDLRVIQEEPDKDEYQTQLPYNPNFS